MVQLMQLDASGMPRRWLSIEQSILLYAKDRVLWELGEEKLVVRGGHNHGGVGSEIALSPVIATSCDKIGRRLKSSCLNNALLFRRDNDMCMYCGGLFHRTELTRDHIIPRVQGGPDLWTNVVAACQRCNHFKGGRRPEEAKLELLAVP